MLFVMQKNIYQAQGHEMISFKNKEQIQEWLVNLDNNVTILKARIACEERQCRIVEKTTDGFEHKTKALEAATAVKNCADMVAQYLK